MEDIAIILTGRFRDGKDNIKDQLAKLGVKIARYIHKKVRRFGLSPHILLFTCVIYCKFTKSSVFCAVHAGVADVIL